MDVERSGAAGQLADVAPGGRTSAPSEVLAALPPRVAGAYALAGAAWIVGSDLAVAGLGDEALGDRLPEIAKGLLFVAVTAAVLLVVLRWLTRRFDRMFLRTITAQRDFFETVLSTSSDVVVILDPAGRIVYVNDAVVDLLDRRPDDMIGRRGRDFVHRSDRPAAIGFREAVAAGDARSASRTFLLSHRDGTYRSVEVAAAPLALAGGEPGVVLNARDVTDRARSERQLRAALAEDVTGLPGLRMFVAEMEVIDELRPEGLTITVAMADVDRFADINELHGRSGGDVVLRELAGRITSAVPEALGVWRHGADEFAVVLLEDGEGATAPQALAERLRSASAVPVSLDEDGRRVAVELSVGVARLDVRSRADGAPLSAVLLREAESALADAKRHPDRLAVRLGGEASGSPERARLLAELHDAIDRGELVVHYQPEVHLADLRTAGVEALVRWQHPERGLLAPGEFLPAVAEANLSAAVVRVVLDDALRRAADWAQRPGCDDGFWVSVNVSADDLRRRRFVEDVFEAIDRSGAEAERLCLELTEQTLLADPVAARQVVDRLRSEGIRVAIDDFGTGYSTLEHIRVFEVDLLKIDKGFVRDLGSSPADEVIVDSVLAITERIGVRVVAEGIEHAEALAYLRERGCVFGQGYLLSPPVPPDEIDPCRRWEPTR